MELARAKKKQGFHRGRAVVVGATFTVWLWLWVNDTQKDSVLTWGPSVVEAVAWRSWSLVHSLQERKSQHHLQIGKHVCGFVRNTPQAPVCNDVKGRRTS